ncbi:hypothetical protein [Clostridium saccharobutylicum]|uniref:hypothetical protein n=1 Tax=Clostridium saccharobutylicum TaxID=169679 RepID=UPI0017CDE419|nr:hypothetical protein [Clostridium saccharobutylicum]MBA9009333.1 hypothetical protein [Clostridium saccharobutylicum]
MRFLKDIMARKNIGNSKEAIIDEYMKMLENGYSSLKEQVELFGGNKLLAIKKEADSRFKEFKDGTIIDIFKNIYNVADEEIGYILVKYMEFLTSYEFSFKVNQETFYKFLEEDLDELDKQAKRFDF